MHLLGLQIAQFVALHTKGHQLCSIASGPDTSVDLCNALPEALNMPLEWLHYRSHCH